MTSLWKLWQATAVRRANKVAVIDADTNRSWTCAELTEEAEARAATIRDGIFCRPNGAAWFIEFLACQKAGLAAVPLDPTLPAGAQTQIRAQLKRRCISLKCIAVIKLTSGTAGSCSAIPCSPNI